MATEPNKYSPNVVGPRTRVAIKLVLLIAFMFSCYMLLTSMQKHHFFDGGQMNKHSELLTPERKDTKQATSHDL